MTTRITYFCPKCGDPDAPDATHTVTTDGTFFWNVKTQEWQGSDPGADDLYCSDCGEIGRTWRDEIQLPDLSPAEELKIAHEIAQAHETKAAVARAKVRELEADIEAREAFVAAAARLFRKIEGGEA
jgi:hypothetical protein